MSFSGGEKLRDAREQKGLTVDDVAARLKVPARYIVALEQGDLASLPEPTFVRGYVKAYARTVGVDAAELLDSVGPVEVKAPRPLVAVDSVTASHRKAGARAPKFRGTSHRHHWLLGGVVAVALLVWAAWPGQQTADQPSPSPVEAPVAALPPPPAAPAADGMVTLAVPLPGSQPAPAANTALPAPGANTALPPPVAAQAAAPAAAAGTAGAPAAPAPSVPGLVLRFRGTSWVEVRDVDNVVLHTSVALAGSELKLDGKPPLTVTLGDSAMADVWYSGERVAVDRFARSGVARIIVGQAVR